MKIQKNLKFFFFLLFFIFENFKNEQKYHFDFHEHGKIALYFWKIVKKKITKKHFFFENLKKTVFFFSFFSKRWRKSVFFIKNFVFFWNFLYLNFMKNIKISFIFFWFFWNFLYFFEILWKILKFPLFFLKIHQKLQKSSKKHFFFEKT